jgi:tetrahydrodipicolinate N-succinyltransferase
MGFDQAIGARVGTGVGLAVGRTEGAGVFVGPGVPPADVDEGATAAADGAPGDGTELAGGAALHAATTMTSTARVVTGRSS